MRIYRKSLLMHLQCVGAAFLSLSTLIWAVSPPFLQVLFQHRHLSRTIAARNFKPSSAVPAIVCWADILLAKLGDLSTFLATDFRGSRPDRPLPDVLLAHQQEDSTRAAVQLPGNINFLYAGIF